MVKFFSYAVKKESPTLPNPTVIEAIIEVHFDKSLGNDALDKILTAYKKNYRAKKEDILICSAQIDY